MNAHNFVLAVCILTVLAHISLIWSRGWLIGELHRAVKKVTARQEQSEEEQKKRQEQFEEEQRKRMRDFEDEHRAPWNIKKRTA